MSGCNTCCKCYEQADGSVIQREERADGFYYTLPDSSVTKDKPADFVTTKEVSCEKCKDSVYVGKLYKLSGDLTPATTIDWWAPTQGTYPNGSNAAPHDNVSNIFSVVNNTLVHVNGAPDASFVSPTFSSGGTSSAAFVVGVGAASSAETSGTDQLVARGWFVTTRSGVLTDTNQNTGERGGLWIDECGNSGLQLVSERTDNTVGSDRGVFSNIVIPAGIHYVEAAISDLTAYAGFQLSISYDDGVTQEEVIAYAGKPHYECIQVLRCTDSGVLYDGSQSKITPLEITEFDTWCQPACSGDGDSSESELSLSALLCYGDSSIEAQPISAEFDSGSASGGNSELEVTSTNVFIYESDDGMPELLSAMSACIDSGNTSNLSIVDDNGTTHTFEATAYSNASSRDWNIQGTNTSGTTLGFGAIVSMTHACSADFNEPSGRAFAKYEDGALSWYDSETGEKLSDDSLATLHNCPVEISNECLSVSDKNLEINKKCFEKKVTLIDTLDTIDTGGLPIEREVLITPSETGEVDGIAVRVDNVGNINNTGNIQFFLDGVSVDIIGNTNVPPNEPDLSTLPAARAVFTLDINQEFLAGTTYVLTATYSGNIADNTIQWSKGTNSDGNQVAFNTGGANDYPDVEVYQDDYEYYTSTEYADGRIVLRDPSGDVVEDIPSSAEQVGCDNKKLTDSPEEETGGSATIIDGTFTFPSNAKSLSIAPNDTESDYDFVGGAYNTTGSRISMSVGQGNKGVVTNSDAATLTARGTVQVVWEV